MKITNKVLLAGILAIAPAFTVQAQIAFTFSGTADFDGVGYSEGQAVSFTFIIADSTPTFSTEGAGNVRWEDFGAPSGQLIQSVTGTGITGSWLAPAFEGGSNSQLLVEASPIDRFLLSLATFDYNPEPVNIGGLQANGFELGQIIIQTLGQNPFGITTVPEGGSPTEFLADLFGTYAVTGLFADIYDIGDENSVSFSIDTITIGAVSSVPEPSAYAAILGGLTLGVVMLRRRRR